MSIILKSGSKNDVQTIINSLSELYLELGEEAESLKFLNKELIQSVIDSGKTEIYLIKEDSHVCGIISLTETQAIYSGGKYGTLDEMYIKPKYRNKNIGRTCLEKIKVIAETKKWKRLDVTAPTDEKWARTVDFYKKFGFVYTGPKLKLVI